jgi:hypothetical protein
MAFQQPTLSDNKIIHRFTALGGERIPVTDWTIQVRDAYNLGYVYTMVHDWIIEEGWGRAGENPRDDSFFPETYYMQREHPTFGKEIWLRWRLTKPAGPGKSMFRYMMDVDWKIIGLKDTEIAWKGQKVKADKGEFEVFVRSALLIDNEKEWTKWPFKNIKDFYVKRQMRTKITMHKKTIYSDTYRFRDLVMNYLKLETFMPTKELGEFYLKRTLE